MLHENTSPTDWEELTEFIADGKCVLFLGPGATVNYANSERQTQFFEELVRKYPNYLYSYNKGDGFLIFINRDASSIISQKVKKFYEASFDSEMLAKLAQIPFHFIILLSPDMSLNREMKSQNFAFQSDYFGKPNVSEAITPNKNSLPLLYHIMGCTEDANSLLVSHADMYKYISEITTIKQSNQYEWLKTALSGANVGRLLFLGVDFDKWYFQLILNVLNLENIPCIRHAYIHDKWESPVRSVWEKHFRIDFVPNQITEFVDTLHQHCKQKKLLRKPIEDATISRNYKLSSFMKFFVAALSAEDLTTFCMCNYEKVYEEFTSEQSKSTRINKLMEYVKQHNDYENMLNLMKEENQVQFNKINNESPYYD